MLRDGRVTELEYRDAIDATLTCIRAGGYVASDPVSSPVDGLLLVYEQHANGRPQDQFARHVDECKVRHASWVEAGYLSTHPHVMDEPLRQAVAACLLGAGVELSGDEPNAEAFVDAGAEPDQVVDCAVTEGGKLYPPKTTFVFGFEEE